MLDDLIKSMFLGGFFSEADVNEDGDVDPLKKALSEHKEPAHIFESAENVGLKGQIMILQGALVDFAKERELLAEEVERLHEEISKFEEENTRLWHENEHFRSENQNLKGVLRQQDEEVADLQARISDLYSRMETAPEADGDESADKVDETSVSAGAEIGGDEEVSDGESADEADESSVDGDDKTEDSNPAGVKEEWVGY